MELRIVDQDAPRAFPAECYSGEPFRIHIRDSADDLFWAFDQLIAEGFEASFSNQYETPMQVSRSGIDARYPVQAA